MRGVQHHKNHDRQMTKNLITRLSFALGVLLTAANAHADNANFDPNLDRWMYPFNQTVGSRAAGSTFGAVGTPDAFDDRDAQFLVGFDTSNSIQSGLGATNYQINSISLKLTISTTNTLVFDPTSDAWDSYLDDANPANDDLDPGRPMELFGVDYRNFLTSATFTENTAFSFGDPTLEGVRNAFATDFDGAGNSRDVSNNVRDMFDPNAFAVGDAGVAAGDTFSSGTEIVFNINVLDPNIVSYIQEGLDAGQLNFAATSLHSATQGGGEPIPEYFTKENAVVTLGLIPNPSVLSIDFTIVPEPGTSSLFGIGVALFAWRRRQWKGDA